MRGWKRALPIVVIVLSLAFLARRFLPSPAAREGAPAEAWAGAPRVGPAAAAEHVGRLAVVCGRVAGAARPRGVRGSPTFLNFGAPHPDQDFTAVIWGRHLPRFEVDPLEAYRDASLCVAGRVREHRGVPQIEVRGASQVRVEGAGAGRPR